MRARYHEMLNQAMDATPQGESFLPEFTRRVLLEAKPMSIDDYGRVMTVRIKRPTVVRRQAR